VRRTVWLLILFTLLTAWSASADPVAAPVVESDRFAETQIHRETSTALPATSPSAPANSSVNTPELDLTRVVVSLATVVALIFGLRWISRKMFPSAAQPSNPLAVRILARCPISPRQNILLLHIGRRVLVVGDTGGNLASLGEITDADEIAALIAQTKSEVAGRNPLGAMFARARKNDENEMGHESVSVPDDPLLKTAELELAGLSQRIHALARELK